MILFHLRYFTLHKLINNSIFRINRHVKEIVNRVLSIFKDYIQLSNYKKNIN